MVVGTLFRQDIAQVDPWKFEKVGSFQDVHVIPNGSEGSIFATKSMSVAQSDKDHETQHCLYVHLNLSACDLNSDESLVAHSMYEDENGDLFVDASYSFELGILTFQQYFLLRADECDFAADLKTTEGGSPLVPLTLEELEAYGQLVRVS